MPAPTRVRDLFSRGRSAGWSSWGALRRRRRGHRPTRSAMSNGWYVDGDGRWSGGGGQTGRLDISHPYGRIIDPGVRRPARSWRGAGSRANDIVAIIPARPGGKHHWTVGRLLCKQFLDGTMRERSIASSKDICIPCSIRAVHHPGYR